MHSLTVPDDAAGGRLDRFLASLEEVGSRAAAERLIETGAVTVDGRSRPKSHKLAAGQTINFPALEPVMSELVPHEMDIQVVYRDDHLLVVDKPAGLLVHPVPGYSGPTLVHGLLHEIGGEGPRPGIVHRLDRDTSGLLVVARDDRTLARLQSLLRRRRIHRSYSALVRGRPALAARHHRGADRPRPARPDPRLARLGRGQAGRHALHDRRAVRGPHAAGRASSRPAARTRSASTWRRSAARWWATASTGTGPSSVSSASSCTPRGCGSRIPWSGEQIDVASPLPPDLAAALELARGGAVRAEPGFR